jgi:ABC-2 type transport system ATP-binding protein
MRSSDRVVIYAQGLTKTFGFVRAVDQVSFKIRAGEIVGYLGPNGAGKTTTIKMLVGLLKPTLGSARIAGHDVTTHPVEVKKLIGYVPEHTALYENLTAYEYLRFVGQLHEIPQDLLEARVEEYLRYLEMLDHLYELIRTFSKGMKQKIALAGALLHNPEILFLDEPIIGLDVHAIIKIDDLIQRFASQGKTIFYSSHIMEVVERTVRRVIIIDKGRIILDDTLENALARSRDGSLKEIFRELTAKEG